MLRGVSTTSSLSKAGCSSLCALKQPLAQVRCARTATLRRHFSWGLARGTRRRHLLIGSLRCAAQGDRGGGTMPKDVWAFDFDGVVCDSVGESSLSAWKAAAELWPEVFDTPEAAAKKEDVLEGMRAVRPVVETGYENLVQVRCLLEGVSVEDILGDWQGLLGRYMDEWGLDRSDLVKRFGGTRDRWIEEDLQGWLAPNRIYDGVPDVLTRLMQQAEVYIVTTKQEHFTHLLLRDMAHVPLPLERIFSQTVSGRPKSEVLEKLQEAHPGAQYHFVEDKLGTLEKVCKLPALEHWQLYLVDWGYNTAAERERAAANPRIQLLSLGADFEEAAGVASAAAAKS